MSTTIDERVVQMRFDNKQFEQNVSTTMGTMRKLDETIKSLDHTTGLENLSNATKGISLDGIANSVEAVKDKFSALSIVGITALMNISNQAVEAGKKLVNALTIEPIKTGFNEYELKMGSIQTIMASTGESLETVNGYLNELNKYSDKTIYSFSDMTQNIGKFTNAGVKLEDAVAAIKGISNEAAVSGANANEAARAMYNFAQALSAGYVKLIDWKSIENANMATVEFKNQLLDTALALGTVVKQGDRYVSTTTDMNGKVSAAFNATSNFNDSLSAQWMTTDVLTQTLQNYSVDVREMSEAEKKAYEEKLRGMGYTEEQIKSIEALGQKAYDSAQDIKTFSQMLDTLKESAQSGWAESWELIFGNFEEAKSLWTAVGNEISNILQKQADERNQLLRDWADNGGQAYFFDAIKTAWEGLKDVISEVKKAFENVFPPVTADTLKNISINLAEFAENLRPTQDQLDKIRTIFQGVFSAVDIFRQALSALSPYLSMFRTIADGFLTIASTIAQFITRIDEAISRANVFKNAMSGVFSVINGITNAIGGFDIIKTKVDNVSTALQNSGIEWSKYKKVVKDATDEEVTATKNAVDKEQQIRKAGAAANLQTTQDSIEDQKKAVQKGLDDQYKMQEKAYDQENKLKKKACDQAYKDLQKSLDAEYKARQKELDTVYKDLQKSLNEEVKAAQEANKERQELAQKSYDEEVKAFKKATNEKIGLINEEYLESIKLIDEEKYNRLKAIDDQIKAINDQAEAEEKARKQTERDNKIAELNNSINTAKSTRYRKQKEQELAEYLEKIKQEELAEERKETIARLNEEKDRIQEEADLKAEEARDKRDQAIETVQEESEATLSGMAEAHEAEMEEMRKAHEEQIEAMREANSERLAVLKESQSEELSAIREKNSARLSELKEFQNDEMALIKEAQKEQLDLLKENNNEALKSFQDYQQEELDSFEEVSEAKIEAIEEEKEALVDLSDVAYALRKMDLSTAEGTKKAQELLQEEYGLTAEDAKKAVDAVMELSDANEEMTNSITNAPVSGALEKIRAGFEGIAEVAKPAMEAGKNFVIGFKEGLVGSSGGIFDSVVNFGKSILSKFRDILGIHSPSTETFQDAYNFVQGFVLGFIDAIPIAINTIGTWITTLLKSVETKIVESVGIIKEKIKETFSNIFSAAKEVDTSDLNDFSKNTLERLLPIAEILEGIKSAFVAVGGVIKEAAIRIKEYFDTINARHIKGDLSRALGLITLVEINNLMKKIFKGVKNFGEVGLKISSALGEVKKAIKTFEKEVKAKSMKVIATAILELAAAMFILSTIDSNKLLGVVGVMSTLFIELGASMKQLAKITGGNNPIDAVSMNTLAMQLIKLSTAVLILAKAAKILSEVDSDKLFNSVMGVGLLLEELVGAIFQMTNIEGKMETTVGKLIGLATAVLILSAAVKVLSSIDIGTMWSSIGAIGVLCIELGILAGLSENFKASNGAGMLATAAALLVLVGVVAILGHINVANVWLGIGAIGGLVVELGILGATCQDFKFSNGAGILAASAAMLVLTGVVAILGHMDPATIKQGELALLGISVCLGILAGLGSEFGVSNGAGILLLATALVVLSAAIERLGSMPIETLVQGGIAMAAFIAILGGAAALLQTVIGPMYALAGVLALAGAAMLMFGLGVTALAVGMTILSASSVAGAAALVASLNIIMVGVLGAITNSIYAFKELVKAFILSSVDVITESAPEIAEGVLVMILEVLKSLNKFAPDILEQLFDFLIMLINKLADRIPEFVDAIANVLSALFTSIIDKLNNLDPDFLTDAIMAIGFIDGFMLSLAALAALAPPAMLGVLGVAGVLTELTLLLTGIGALAQIPGLEWLISEGGGFLETIGTAIGKFFGGIAGGILNGISDQLPELGSVLTTFMQNASGFIEGAKMLDQGAAEGVEALARMILAITAAEILSGIASWLSGGSSIVKFGEELEEFGPHIKNYANSVKGIDVAAIKASAAAANILADMAKNLPNSGGLAAKIFGDNSLAEFGKELESFGPHIKKYGEDVKGLDTEAVTASVSAAQILSDMASKLPNSGGLAAKILGDNTLSQFGKELESFGPHIKAYGDDVKDLNTTAVKASVSAAQILADMATKLPNQGGVVSWFTGDNTLSMFGKELEKFAPYIKSYGDTVSSVNASALTASTNAVEILADLAKKMPKKGGLGSLFTGENGLESFGKTINQLGIGLSEYSKKVSSINLGEIYTSTQAIKAIIDLIKSMSGLNVFGINNFSKCLKELARSGIDDFVNSFKNADVQVIQAVEEFIQDITKGFDKKKFTPIGSGIVSGITEGYISSENKINELIKKTLNNITQNSMAFNAAGSRLINSFKDGISYSSYIPVNSVSDILVKMKERLNKYEDFRRSGSYLIDGFVSGIREKSNSVGDAVNEVARRAVDQLRSSLDIHSPSRITRGFGEFFDEGLISGIKALSSKVGDTAGEIGTRAVETLQSTLKDATDMFDGEFAEPTIRPVLDLTDISRGTSQISQMLDTSGTLKMAADVSTYNFRDIGGLMNDMIEAMPSDDNTDVIDAINDLNTNMVNVMSTLGKLQVVLDTGTMVGELVNPIDQALGFNSVLNKRGVR